MVTALMPIFKIVKFTCRQDAIQTNVGRVRLLLVEVNLVAFSQLRGKAISSMLLSTDSWKRRVWGRLLRPSAMLLTRRL